MKSSITTLLILALSLSFCAFTEEAELPKISAKAGKAIISAKSKILKDYNYEVTKLIRDLERIKAEEMKSGDLEGAVAVDTVIKEIQNDFLLTDIIKDKQSVKDLLGKEIKQKKLIDQVIASWIWNDVEVIFDEKGNTSNGGKWKLEGEQVVITKFGRTYTIKFNDDFSILSGPRDDGLTLTIRRVVK